LPGALAAAAEGPRPTLILLLIRQGEVRWQPAIDVNRAILGGQVVAIVALLVIRAIVKARSKTKRAT